MCALPGGLAGQTGFADFEKVHDTTVSITSYLNNLSPVVLSRALLKGKFENLTEGRHGRSCYPEAL
jgi:hypothetical protein